MDGQVRSKRSPANCTVPERSVSRITGICFDALRSPHEVPRRETEVRGAERFDNDS